MEMPVKSTICFNEFTLDTKRRLLEKNSETVSLNPKTLDLLVALIENHGEVVSKNELLDKIWTDQFVEENNLTVHVAALRKALGEKKGDHRFIVTVPGRGYSFVAAVEEGGIYATNDEGRKVESLDKISSPLIGRTREISEIENRLRCGDENRLITLTGAGGSGKTSLARTVAGNLLCDFADGVFFIEFAAVNTPELVVLTITNTLGVKETGRKLLIDVLIDYLQTRRTLLILDNFEQILSAAPILQKIVNSTSFLKILVTSRAPLHIYFEQEVVVTPLALPPIDAVSANLNDYAAIELFVQRAQSNRRGFVLTGENAACVAEICRRLDGLPLAIELAAARVRLLSPSSILERLENSLNLLTSIKQDLPARQRTMRGAIEWSFNLLDEDEKAIFRQLSVFADGFTVKAAEAVCITYHEFVQSETQNPKSKIQNPKSEVLDLLTSLADNNLLSVLENENGDVRLRMLEVVREFAAELLEESDEPENVRRRHSDYFLALAEEAEPHLSGEKSAEWLEKLETEHNNFRAALRRSLEKEPETAAHLAAALRHFWSNRSHLTEARSWLEAALEKQDNAPEGIRFKLLNAFSLIARNQGDYSATRRASEESLAASRAINDLRQVILSCHSVAGLELREGNLAAARKLFEESLIKSRELGDEKQIAITLSGLGNVFLAEQNPAAARMPFEESLEIFRRLGFKLNLSLDLFNLGTVGYYDGKPEEASRHFFESLEIARKMGNKLVISCCLDGLAAVTALRRKPEKSAYLSGAAESLRESIGYEIEPTERFFHEDYLAKTRSALDEKTFIAAYQKGQTLDLSEAVALAEDLFSEEQIEEIIIETHRFERIVIEEEVDAADFSNDYDYEQSKGEERKKEKE